MNFLSIISDFLPKAPAPFRCPALCVALSQWAREGCLDEHAELLAAAARAGLVNSRGDTLLHWAVRSGDLQRVRFLVEAGADAHACNCSGHNALHEAVLCKQPDLLRYFLQLGVNASCRDRQGASALHFAVTVGDAAALTLLLEAGCSTESLGAFAFSPLHVALDLGFVSLAQILLEKGAVVESRDKFGRTPLILAARKGSFACLRLMLEAGADSNARDAYTCSPMVEACERGLRWVQELLAYGARLNVRTYWGEFPLAIAARRGDFELVRFLLDVAEPSWGWAGDELPLKRAIEWWHFDVARFLIAAGAPLSREVMRCAARKGDLPFFKELLSLGCVVRGEGSSRLLEAAAREGHCEMFEFLLAQGASFEPECHFGLLFVAYLGGVDNVPMLSLLLTKGLDVNLQDEGGFSLLHWAAMHGEQAMVRFLLEAGADTALRTSEGDTPIDLARAFNREQIFND